MIAMRMRDHGTRNCAPGIDVKVAGRAVEAVSGFLKHSMCFDCNIKVRTGPPTVTGPAKADTTYGYVLKEGV